MTTITDVRLTPVAIPRSSGLVCGHVIVQVRTNAGIGVGEMSDFQHLPRYHVDVEELERTLTELLGGMRVDAANEVEKCLEESFPRAGSAANLDIVAARLEQGFYLFRVYVGRRLDLDEKFLWVMVDRFGDRVQITSLDFSNLLDSRAAVRFVNRTAEIGYELVEAPARERDTEGLAYVRDHVPAMSEHVHYRRWALDLAAARAVDVFNIGLFTLGGITPARSMVALAEAAEITCLVGTTQELTIGTAAAAHFGVATPAVTVASDPVGPLLYTDDVVAGALTYRDSRLHPPTGPGLGVTIDADRLVAAHGPLRWEGDVTSVVDRTVRKPS